MLTDAQIKKTKATGKDHRIRDKAGKDSGYHGFGLKVTATGKKSFFLEYTFGTKRRFLNLGHYPSTSLSDARDSARQARKLLNKGIDPQVDREITKAKQEAERVKLEQEKIFKKQSVTVNTILDHYLDNLSHHTKTDASNIFTNKHCNVRKKIGKLAAPSVTDELIEQLLELHTNRGKHRTAGKLYSYMRAAFTKAKKHKPFMLKRWSNPFDTVEKPQESNSKAGDRTLSDYEINKLWLLLNDSSKLDHGIASILKVLLLTGQRVEQTSRMQWKHIDLNNGTWDVPAMESKTGKKSGVGLIVPLASTVIEILKHEQRDDQWVFPGAREGQPYSLGGISTALRKALNENPAIDHFTPRDLRRTCTTHWSRIGIIADIRNRIQDHSIPGVEAKHYDRHDYLKEKRAALEKWERELKRIIGEPESDNNVIELKVS